MDSDQRLKALQKSYDDMILNTTNEASAKVLAAERKAQELEHELQVTKYESVQLMIRLKKLMYEKIISEAKINELEAQREGAEDILVSQLRGALRYVQDKFERMSKNDVNKHKNVTPKEAFDKENLCLNMRNEYPKSCAQAIQMRNLYGAMPEFASILLRSKEQKEAAVCKYCCTSCQYEVETIDLILKAGKTATNTKHRKKRIASSKKIPDRLFRKLHETPVLVPQSDPTPKSVKKKAPPSEGPTPMIPKSPSSDNAGDIRRLINSKAAKPPADSSMPIVQESASLQLFKYTYQRKRKRET